MALVQDTPLIIFAVACAPENGLVAFQAPLCQSAGPAKAFNVPIQRQIIDPQKVNKQQASKECAKQPSHVKLQWSIELTSTVHPSPLRRAVESNLVKSIQKWCLAHLLLFRLSLLG
jgi:hypothetical protein